MSLMSLISLMEKDRLLILAVDDGSMGAVEAALQAGADVDGSPEHPLPPIVVATLAGHAAIVELLLERGANPDKNVTEKITGRRADMVFATAGERSLHIVARSGKVEIVRLLLKGSSADVNAIDDLGRTPLMGTCILPHVSVEVVQLLLEADADPALADKTECTPLHVVAGRGHMDLVDMVYSAAPATLNLYTSDRETPLYMACFYGHESMVSKLLSLGATQRISLGEPHTDPLSIAVTKGFLGVVRVLITEEGRTAVGGGVALFRALCVSVVTRRARILRLLLMVGGEERRSEWANIETDGRTLLNLAAAFGCPAAVSILLEAGADEAARDPLGGIPLDVVGVNLGQDGEPEMDPEKAVATRRMLQRGPAYRARSWAWPSEEEADAGGSGDGGTSAAAAVGSTAAGSVAVLLHTPPAVKTPPVIGVRIFRPKEKSSSKFFVRIIGRYCAKD